MIVRFLKACSFFVIGFSWAFEASAATAQASAVCASDQAQIDRISNQINSTVVWNDAQLARARATLEKVQVSHRTIAQLAGRVRSLEESGAIDEDLDRASEARVWNRDAAELRQEIAAEARKAKILAATVGVTCPGCAFSVLEAKLKSAIETAVAAPTKLAEDRRALAMYEENFRAWGCTR